MIIVGLTGIMGSGKSTVTSLLKHRGLKVIDLDALAKDSLNWKETQNDIKQAFGEEYVIDNRVDVEALRRTVFNKDDNLRRLEAIIHPRVREEVQKRLAAFEKSGVGTVIIDHPLLFETGFHRKMDKIVVVTAKMDIIKERLKKRGMDADDIERRLSFQVPLEQKEKMADYVIDNNGTEDQLKVQVDSLHEKITKWEVNTTCI
ncbi:MAG: Dephospho-CoA kinase [Syntrophorhabdaceae bacterium PtaU1.Bin034]|jgi:dephospho-CoA kinase|nr:MAG: Dephospho-CoA kinase [Syntrophorhabdaceae bacterium PtaU1.Bin034]